MKDAGNWIEAAAALLFALAVLSMTLRASARSYRKRRRQR